MAIKRKFALTQWLTAGLTAALLQASLVDATGLGRLNVLSQMGQPFAGEIELLNVNRDDLSTLSARVAPSAAYQAANLRFDPALNSMRLSVEHRANGTPYLRASSTRPVAEPYLDLLVELTSPSGRFVRQYSALLDPPGLVEPPVAPAQQAQAAPAAPAAAKPAPRPAPAPRVAAAAPSVPLPTATAPAVIPTPPRIAAAPVAPTPAAPTPSAKAAPAEAKPADAPKAEVAKPKGETPAVEAPKAVTKEVEAPRAEAPKPAAKETEASPAPPSPVAEAPQKKIVPPSPPAAPAPQRGIIDIVMDNLVPLGAGALALLAGLGFLLFGRRKQPGDVVTAPAAPAVKVEPQARAAATVAPAVAAPAVATSATPAATTHTAPVEPTVANVTDMVDPIEEAQVYLEHGADQQAEDILRKALTQAPNRTDVRLKLLEILANRSDKNGFAQIATTLREQTGGTGEQWIRASMLGAAIDPSNPMYGSGAKASTPAAPRAADAGLDFDLGSPAAASDPLSNTTQILLQDEGANLDMEKTMVLTRADLKPAAPPAEAPLEFNFQLPPASPPAPEKPAPAAAKQADSDDRGLDFKIDIPNVNLNLDDKQPPALNPAFEVKSAQWEEVQQKFDLVLAYKEMGDKDGMLEALQEIEREGDAAQKAHAQKMMQELKGA